MDILDVVKVTFDNNNKKLACKECKYYARTFVPSYIVESAILVAGEAPGGTESNKKVPCQGLSGQLLRKLLREVGFDDEKISYANVVCCHPPGNETPDKNAIIICSKQFLFPVIRAMNFKLVILTGSVALNVFFPGKKIMEKKGSILVKDGITFLPVLHPAYCLRNVSSTIVLKNDLEKAKLFLDGNLYAKKKYKIVKDVEEIDFYKKIVLEKEIFSVDIETTGLDPLAKDAKIWTIAFGYKEKEAICFPLEHPESENVKVKELINDAVKEILVSKNAKIFHNCSFDLKFLKKFGFEVNGVIHDTMVMSYLLDENRSSNSLKVLSSDFLDGYDTFYSRNLQELGQYNCADADNTLRLFNIFVLEIAKFEKLYNLYKFVLMPMCKVIADIELLGILVDTGYINKLSKRYTNKIESILDVIHTDFPDSINVDLNSPKQLGVLLFDKLQYSSVKKTKTGQKSVDSEVLEKLVETGNSFAKYLLKLRNYEKLLSTYVKNVPNMISFDGRLHGNFNICGTRTGRMSSSNPNLQNIPRNKDIKRMFVSRDGYNIMNVDASQAELRVGCSIANEQEMIKAYNEGMDIHRLTASKCLNKKIEDVTDSDRQKAKGVNFGFLYGSSAEGFKRYTEIEYGLNLSLDECIGFRKLFFSTYPGFSLWYKKVEESLRKYGHVEYPDGRFARFPNVIGLKEIPQDILRKGINYQVQGGTSHIILYVMVKLVEYLKINNVLADIIVTVHDSIVVECKESSEEQVMGFIETISSVDVPKMFPWLKVPMLFDFAVGKNWGDLKKL